VSGCCGVGQIQRLVALSTPLSGLIARFTAHLRRGMLSRALLLIALGLILGPIYSAYWEALSGTLLERHALTDRADRWTLPDGTIQRFRGGLAYRPVTLKLAPEMNRVRLRLSFEAVAGPAEAPSGNEYLATLLDVDHPLFERALQLGAAPGGKTTLDVRTFEIFTPGDYLFLLEEVGKPASSVTAVTLEVWQRAELASRPVVWCGFGLLLAGMGIAAYTLIAPPARRPKA